MSDTGGIESLLNTTPPPAGGTSTRDPIGVPNDYAAPPPPPSISYTQIERPVAGGGLPESYYSGHVTVNAPIPPRYFTQDSYAPQGWPAEKIGQLQIQLANAGLLTSDFRLGMWDSASRNAYTHVLGYANQTGTDWTAALAALASNPPIDPKTGRPAGSGPTRAPLTIRKTNPDDLAKVADAVATAVLGGGLSQEDRARFIRSFHQMEAAKQRDAYNGKVTGGAVVDSPDATTLAENQLRNAHPVEATSHDVAGVFDQFLHLIGGQ